MTNENRKKCNGFGRVKIGFESELKQNLRVGDADGIIIDFLCAKVDYYITYSGNLISFESFLVLGIFIFSKLSNLRTV